MRSYEVATVCAEDGCAKKIDHGEAYRCNDCGGYYCYSHLWIGVGQFCGFCFVSNNRMEWT